MQLNKALSIANGIVESLSPHSEIINIAGSCRRGRVEVKDIEIIVLPKPKIIKDVFGEDMAVGRSKEFISTVQLLGEVLKGSPLEAKYMQVKLKEGINLDLFLPLSVDYYRQFALRTGSADYSKNVLAAGWRKIGWCGSDAGLRRTSDCIQRKPSGWKCVNPKAILPPAWKSEREFFDWIKVRWVEPSLRNY